MIEENKNLEEKKATESRILKKVLNILDKILFFLLLSIIVFSTFILLQSKITGRSPSINGYKLYVVDSGSMTPTLKVGTLIVVKESQDTEINIGDIITYHGADTSVVTHRVLEIDTENGTWFITKGDANETEDPMPVESNKLIGKVTFSIPYVGFILQLVRSKFGIIGIIILVLIAIITQYIKPKNDQKQNTNDEEVEPKK